MTTSYTHVYSVTDRQHPAIPAGSDVLVRKLDEDELRRLRIGSVIAVYGGGFGRADLSERHVVEFREVFSKNRRSLWAARNTGRIDAPHLEDPRRLDDLLVLGVVIETLWLTSVGRELIERTEDEPAAV